MSRLAKRSIPLPKGVEVKIEDHHVEIKGPKGHLSHDLPVGVQLKQEEGAVRVDVDPSIFSDGSVHGLHWALIKNKIIGVSEGVEKKLTLIGVGYRAAVQGNKLDLQVGFSHPTVLEIPSDLQVKVEKSTTIIVSGVDKQLVGQFAARIRSKRPPEPYKGKGIRYENEYVRKKAGKAAKSK